MGEYLTLDNLFALLTIHDEALETQGVPGNSDNVDPDTLIDRINSDLQRSKVAYIMVDGYNNKARIWFALEGEEITTGLFIPTGRTPNHKVARIEADYKFNAMGYLRENAGQDREDEGE